LSERDTRPAIGKPGEPGTWRRAREGADVAGAQRSFGDAAWSDLFKRDTRYAAAEPQAGDIAEINLRMRTAPVPDDLQGPFVKPPVWTWEVPLYFWFGGVASGAAFVAQACDLAGDHDSAPTARRVALGAVVPAPVLLIADLGRPARFLNMMRIFKPRSPMNLGAWCLAAFSTVGGAAVAADLLGRRRPARLLGSLNAVLGGYLGSYTGVLLASTAVPLWARSRLFLGPVFVCTATATGAAAVRLTLVARGLPEGHPTRSALGALETAAIAAELSLSAINERRLGPLARPLSEGRSGVLFRAAKWSVGAGLALRLPGPRANAVAENLSSVAYLFGGLAFRYAWLEAGKASAADPEAAVATARGTLTMARRKGPRDARRTSSVRSPLRAPGVLRAWGETVRRTSLAVERLVR
jgi:formate-dependent nitrite reductase membrane component NrfD